MNRKLFLAYALSLPGIAFGDDKLPSIALSLKEPFDRRLEIARTKLERGQYLDNVIKLLESCIKEQPDRYDLHLDLACANAGRAHVLAKAYIDSLVREKNMETYASDFSDWQKAQQDEKSDLYNTKSPEIPVVVKISDDKSIFNIPLEKLKIKIDYYSQQNLIEISKSKALAEKLESNEDLARVYFVGAWTSAILWRYPRAISKTCLPKNFKIEDIILCIEQSRKLCPENQNLILSHSDILDYIGNYQDFRFFASKKLFLNYEIEPKYIEKSFLILEEYSHINLKSNLKPLIDLRIAVLKENKSSLFIFKKNATDRSIQEISRFLNSNLEVYEAYAKSNPNNAIAWYCYSNKLANNDLFEKSWETTKIGSRKSIGYFPEYYYTIPVQLKSFISSQIILPREIPLSLRYIITSKLSKSKKQKEEFIEAFITGINIVLQLTKFSQEKTASLQSSKYLTSTVKAISSGMITYLFGISKDYPEILDIKVIQNFLDQHSKEVNEYKNANRAFEKAIGDQHNNKTGG